MKNANFMAPIKAFFSKAWTATKAFSIKAGKWIVANKLISIPVAVVLVGGIACAIALPIALHEHDFATEWSSDANNHWHSAICSHEEEKADFGAHAYDNACDTTCNVCGATRTVGAHVYDNDCDTTCNTCGATRTVGAHVYDNACDTTCNTCGATRAITHDHADTLTAGDTTHYYLCSVCGDKKDEVAHVFDKTVASSEYLKAAATATTKAQYYKSCVCGKASATEYFETDKTTGTLANIQDLSKTYDKVELANPTYETNSDGAVTIEWYQGDTKLDAKPVNAGTYKVKVIIAESATYTGISAEKEFTIAKKKLSNLSFEFVYSGESNFDTDYLTEAQGILAADVADGNFIFVQFDSKNVGATATDIEIDFGEEADSYENYEIDMATFTASIVPKVLSNLTFSVVYNGDTYHGGVAIPSGVVAGDEVLVDIDLYNKNVGTYTCKTPEKDESVCWEDISLDGADYENYEIDRATTTITVTKRPVWAENVKFTYDGSTCWTGEESPEAIVFQNVVAGETIDSSFIEWEFRYKDVGSDLVSVDDGEYYANYDFDLSKCSASIIPRVIDNLTYAFEYNGMEYHQAIISRTEHSGIVYDDQISLEVCFATPDVGSALDTDGEFGFEPSFVEENYELGENYNFSIIKKVVTELPATLTAEYKSTYGVIEGLEAPVEIDGIEATLIFVARKSDNNLLYTPGKYTNATITKASLGDNFDLQIDATAKYTITVGPKKLSALNIKITEAQYDKGEFTLVSSKDGVYAPVNVTFSKANYQDVAVGYVFELIIDEDLFMQGREVIAFADSAYAQGYQFVPDANGIVGTMTIVENCDVQYDGSCNCGTSHLTETLTFTSGEAVGNSATIDCDSTYEGGIYKIALEGGEYEFFGTDQFFNISGIYDVYGNTVATSIGTYILPKGTYYFHVYVGSSPSSDTIWVKKTAEYCSFETARVFECQTNETDSFTLSAGDKLYLKVMGGENSKLNDFDISGTDGATFTLAVYGLDDTTEPSYVEETALDYYYWDVCDTEDFYVVLTCVTAGDIEITAVR